MTATRMAYVFVLKRVNMVVMIRLVYARVISNAMPANRQLVNVFLKRIVFMAITPMDPVFAPMIAKMDVINPELANARKDAKMDAILLAPPVVTYYVRMAAI